MKYFEPSISVACGSSRDSSTGKLDKRALAELDTCRITATIERSSRMRKCSKIGSSHLLPSKKQSAIDSRVYKPKHGPLLEKGISADRAAAVESWTGIASGSGWPAQTLETGSAVAQADSQLAWHNFMSCIVLP